MAATAQIATKLTITPTVGDTTEVSLSFTSATAPAEALFNRVVTGSDAFTIDLGDIAAGSAYLLWLRPIVGYFYVAIGVAADATPSATNSHLKIPEGEAYCIPLNPNSTAVPRLRLVGGTATTGAIEYLLIGA